MAKQVWLCKIGGPCLKLPASVDVSLLRLMAEYGIWNPAAAKAWYKSGFGRATRATRGTDAGMWCGWNCGSFRVYHEREEAVSFAEWDWVV